MDTNNLVNAFRSGHARKRSSLRKALPRTSKEKHGITPSSPTPMIITPTASTDSVQMKGWKRTKPVHVSDRYWKIYVNGNLDREERELEREREEASVHPAYEIYRFWETEWKAKEAERRLKELRRVWKLERQEELRMAAYNKHLRETQELLERHRGHNNPLVEPENH